MGLLMIYREKYRIKRKIFRERGNIGSIWGQNRCYCRNTLLKTRVVTRKQTARSKNYGFR
jgi:hypothetical protein